MGIPEPSLNKVIDSLKFAIDINYLRDSCKSARRGSDAARRGARPSLRERKNNSPDGWESASTEGAVHENRGHERPLLESGAKNAPKLVQPTAMRSRTDRASYKSWRYWM
jgi:hypothetical protein